MGLNGLNVMVNRFRVNRFSICSFQDSIGLWKYKDLGSPLPPKPLTPSTVTLPCADSALGPANALAKSFVSVRCTLPLFYDGAGSNLVNLFGKFT
jgi:hypothetical protein